MNEITHEEVEKFLKEASLDLNPNQRAISFPLIQRIHRRLKEGKRFDPIQVADNTIVDGHHRYISQSLLGIEIETIPGGKNLTTQTFTWKNINLEIDDYDTPEKIREYAKLFD